MIKTGKKKNILQRILKDRCWFFFSVKLSNYSFCLLVFQSDKVIVSTNKTNVKHNIAYKSTFKNKLKKQF